MSASPVIRQLAQLDDFATLSDAAAGTASLRTLGTGATQALNKSTADGLYATSASVTAAAAAAPILAPATAARNVIQPTANVVPLSLKARNGTDTADLLQTQTSAGAVFGGFNNLGVTPGAITVRQKARGYLFTNNADGDTGLMIEAGAQASSCIDLVSHGNPDPDTAAPTGKRKVLRVFNPDFYFAPWSPQDPQAYITSVGGFYSRADILLSGTMEGIGTADHRIAKPSPDPAMMWLWSDVNGPALQIRASSFGGEVLTPSFVSANYILSGLSPNGNYVFSVEQNGLLQWGASGPIGTTTRAQMDTYFGRVLFNAAPTLCTNQGLALTTNQKGIYGMKADGVTSVRMLQIDSANQLGLGQNGAGTPVHIWSTTTRFVDDANTVYRVEINASGVTLATGHNIVLATSGAGTKIGTGATQLLGFWGATPVVRPAAYTQTYATATRTHANPTAVALTDNSGGTANTTLELIAGAVYATDAPGIKNNFADLAASNNVIIADLANVKQVLNSLIDDKQATGTCAP